jgi:hypothetical protein
MYLEYLEVRILRGPLHSTTPESQAVLREVKSMVNLLVFTLMAAAVSKSNNTV